LDGITSERDFVSSCILGGVTGDDPFAGQLTCGVQLALDKDIDGRIADAVSNMKKNCYGTICVIPIAAPCLIYDVLCGEGLDGGPAPSSCGENKRTAELRSIAGATKLYLTSDAVVYECAAHTSSVTKNYVSFDQYGHRFPVVDEREVSVPATKLSVPLRHVEVVVQSAKSLPFQPIFSDPGLYCCCKYEHNGSVVAVRVGDGLKTVVACVEVGQNSNAQEFANRCNAAAKSAPMESPELAAMYDAWLLRRLSQTGTMVGGVSASARPPQSIKMERSTSFVKTVGPLPNDLGIVKGTSIYKPTKLTALGDLEVKKKTGQIFTPKASPLVAQLFAGDRLVSINGVPLHGQADDDFFDRVVAAGQTAPQPRFMQLESTMPYFQPNHLVTISLPPGTTIQQLGLADGGDKPPKLLMSGTGVSPLAQSLGCQPGDVVVQATLDGKMHDATSMSAQELVAAASGASSVQLTLLQPALTADISHSVSWPMGTQHA